MKEINPLKITEMLKEELVKANIEINPEVLKVLKYYSSNESIKLLLKNAEIAANKNLPLCQDTGIVEFFVELGSEVVISENIESVLNRVVSEVYEQNYFRYSLVSDPLFERKNTFSNTPCVVNIEHVPGKELKIAFLIKGGGSENLTTLKMFEPSVSQEDIIEFVVEHISNHGAKACPPLQIGIGIGGTAEKALTLSKKALLRSFNERNENTLYKDLEIQLLEKLNKLKIGFQGLGIGPSVLSVNIEYFPTHIATLPVALSVNCYLCRKGVIKL